MDMIPVFHLQKSEGLLIKVMVKGNSIRGYQGAPQDEKKFLQFLQTEVRCLQAANDFLNIRIQRMERSPSLPAASQTRVLTSNDLNAKLKENPIRREKCVNIAGLTTRISKP